MAEDPGFPIRGADITGEVTPTKTLLFKNIAWQKAKLERIGTLGIEEVSKTNEHKQFCHHVC